MTHTVKVSGSPSHRRCQPKPTKRPHQPVAGADSFYGERVHRAVLESGVPTSGCTVHYVTNEYDAGPIILQRSIDVRAGDDVHSLAERVFSEEKLALPEAIRLHVAGTLRRQDGRVVRRP